MAPPPRLSEKTLYAQFARLGKALANPIRLELLDLLCQAPRTVERLAQLVGHSVAATSHHLQTLKSAELVAGRKRGLFVDYSLADDEVGVVWRAVQQLAHQQLADVRAATEALEAESGPTPTIDRVTLTARMRRGEVTLIDVRPPEEYEAGHIPGALSLPLEELGEGLARLTADRELVIYGRGPYSTLASEAVALLRGRNRPAARLTDGVPQWRQAGLPVATGPPE